MAAVVPWLALEAVIEPRYPKIGRKGGRRPFALSTMLRIDCLQQWYNLSDPGAEEALYDIQSMRAFCGSKLGRDAIPDETTILNFRHLLERCDLTKAISRRSPNIWRRAGRCCVAARSSMRADCRVALDRTRRADAIPRCGLDRGIMLQILRTTPKSARLRTGRTIQRSKPLIVSTAIPRSEGGTSRKTERQARRGTVASWLMAKSGIGLDRRSFLCALGPCGRRACPLDTLRLGALARPRVRDIHPAECLWRFLPILEEPCRWSSVPSCSRVSISRSPSSSSRPSPSQCHRTDDRL